MTDLLASGFRLGRPAPPEDQGDSDTAEPTQGRDPVADPAVIARLRAENADLRQRVAVAEALLAEHRRYFDPLQQLALRALPAAPAPPLSWWDRRRVAKEARHAAKEARRTTP